jgi:hypothetical protein
MTTVEDPTRHQDDERDGASARTIFDAVGRIFVVLEALSAEERRRALQAVLTMLGEGIAAPRTGLTAPSGLASASSPVAEETNLNLGPKASSWVSRYQLTAAELGTVFHIMNGQAEVIASGAPGTTKKERTVNCYLLAGIAALLTRDAADFTERDAIALCRHLSAYDRNNHPTNRHAVGSRMTGSREAGFSLTASGLSAAADVVRQAGKLS